MDLNDLKTKAAEQAKALKNRAEGLAKEGARALADSGAGEIKDLDGLKTYARKNPKIAGAAAGALALCIALAALIAGALGSSGDVPSAATKRAKALLYSPQHDHTAAAPLFIAECQKGDIEACAFVVTEALSGITLYKKRGVEHATKTLKAACEKGKGAKSCYALAHGMDAFSMAAMGALAGAGKHDEIDKYTSELERAQAKSVKMLEASCAAGNGDDCELFAGLLADGKGTQASPKRAAEMAERACTLGFAPGCVRAAEFYARGNKRIAAQPERAAKLYAAGCSAGSEKACKRQFDRAKTDEETLAAAEALCELGGYEAYKYCQALADVYDGTAQHWPQLVSDAAKHKDAAKAKKYAAAACKLGSKDYCD